jgi:glycosyltransferase involved in cell wall biosynthesis
MNLRSAGTAGVPDVSVILPVYLNRLQLPELHQRLGQTLGPISSHFELVFVDDCGNDGSLEWLESCQRQDPHTRLVALPENKGQHRAVLEGMRQSSGSTIVVMDADLQDPPEQIPILLEALGHRDAVVFARRHERYQSSLRHATGRFLKRLMRFIAGSRVPAGTGMFFAMSSRVARKVLELDDGAPLRYLPLLIDRTGSHLKAVEIEKDMRTDGVSAYTTRKRLSMGARAIEQALRWRLEKRRDAKVRPPRS